MLNLQQKQLRGQEREEPTGGGTLEPDSDAEAAGAGKPRLSEVTPEGYPLEPPALEQKAASSVVSYVRTSVFC